MVDNRNIITFGIPLVVFETFLSISNSKVAVHYDNEVYDINIDIQKANEYYNKFYTSQIIDNIVIDDNLHFIPIYFDIDNNYVLLVTEAEELGLVSNMESNILYFDAGNGEEKAELIYLSRNYIENQLLDNNGFTIPTMFGSVYFSIDYLVIVLSNSKLDDIDKLPFLINKDGKILGVLIEPKFEENTNLELLKI